MNHRGAGVSFLGLALVLYIARNSMPLGLAIYTESAWVMWLLILVGLGYLVVAELFSDRPRKP